MADFDIKYHVTDRSRPPSFTTANVFELVKTPFASGVLTAGSEHVMIMFGRLGGENTTYNFETEIRVGGTAQGRSRIVEPAQSWANCGNAVTQIVRFTPASGNAVELHARNLDATTRLTVPYICFAAFNIDDLGTSNYLWNEHTTSAIPASSTYSDKASITIPADATTTDQWLVFYECESDSNNTQDEHFVRLVKGTSPETVWTNSERAEESEDTREQLHIGGQLLIQSTTSAQTVTLQFANTQGNCDYIASRIFAFRINSAADIHTFTSDTDYNIAATGTEYTFFSSQITGGGGVSITDDYFCFGSAVQTGTTLAPRTSSAWFRRKNSDTFTVISDPNYSQSPTASGDAANDGTVSSSYSEQIVSINDFVWQESLTSGDLFSVSPHYYEFTDVTTSNDITYHQVVMFSVQKAATGAAAASFSDALTVSDALAGIAGLRASISEALNASDTANGIAHYSTNVQESISVADADSALRHLIAALSNATTASDILNAFLALSGSIVDAASTSDQFNAQAQALASLVEAMAASDQFDVTAFLVALVDENAAVADQWATAAQNIADWTDIAAVQSIMSAIASVFAQIADGSSISDAWNYAAQNAGAFADGIVISGQFVSFASLAASIAESVTVTDTSSAIAALQAQITESASVQEVWQIVSANAGLISDSVSVAGQFVSTRQLIAQLSATAVISDAFAAVAGYQRSIISTITVSDLFDGIAFGIFTSIFNEAASISDDVDGVSRQLSQLIGGINASDVFAAAVLIASSISESASISDALDALQGLVGGITENLQISSLLTAIAAVSSVITDNVSLNDQFNAFTAGQGTFLEQVIVSDLWETGDELGLILGIIRLFSAINADDVGLFPAISADVRMKRIH